MACGWDHRAAALWLPTVDYRDHRQSGYIEATAHAESVAYSRQYASQEGWIFIHFYQKWIRRAREAACLFLSA
jgi:hypothetical protein